MSPILALTLTASLAAPATTPELPSPAPLLTQAARLTAAAPRPASPRPIREAARAAWAPPGGDSLRNGATIGAVVGGVGLGGFVGWLCYMLDETEGSGDCVKAGLLYAGIGAAGGAALGAGVDALFDRPMAVVRFKF